MPVNNSVWFGLVLNSEQNFSVPPHKKNWKIVTLLTFGCQPSPDDSYRIIVLKDTCPIVQWNPNPTVGRKTQDISPTLEPVFGRQSIFLHGFSPCISVGLSYLIFLVGLLQFSLHRLVQIQISVKLSNP